MKRLFDIIVSFIMLLLLIIPFGIISLIIMLDDGCPAIFKQYRVGRDNKLFYIYKFRTMRKDTRNTAKGELSESDECITKIGRILRKTSVDELPQIINVLKGEMSFVGPRPLIPEEKEIRVLRQKYNVYSVKPGLTGLAQVYGRDTLDDNAKAELDKKYVNEQSLLLDLKILFRTVYVVLKRENVIEGSEKVNTR